MIEFLIYNKIHWYDRELAKNPNWLSQQQIRIDGDSHKSVLECIHAKKELIRKYGARYRIGDIVDVRNDGLPRGGKEESLFIFLRVPLDFETAKQYVGSLKNAENRPIRHSQYAIDLDGLTADARSTIRINKRDFLNRVKEKT